MKVFIIGCGVQGQKVLDILREQDLHEVVGFLDDNLQLWRTTVSGVKVLGGVDLLFKEDMQGLGVVVGIASYRVKSMIVSRLSTLNVYWVNVIHPKAVVMKSATLGKGNILQAGAVLDTAAKTGDYVVMGNGSQTGYGCVLDDFSTLGIGAHLSGNVVIGRGVFIGTGASVCPGVHIGAGSVIGAGAAVTNDIPDAVVAVGVPARVIKKIDEKFDYYGRVLVGTKSR